VIAALSALASRGEIAKGKVVEAIARYKVDTSDDALDSMNDRKIS
jgi:pyruvate dehydrogenase complex dehydrogenase (E1) component